MCSQNSYKCPYIIRKHIVFTQQKMLGFLFKVLVSGWMSTNMLQNLPAFPLMWILILVGWYVINRIIKYIKSKPIGTQTLLDGLYVQLLQKWTFEGFMYAMVCTLVELQHTSMISSIMVGWMGNILGDNAEFSSFHLLLVLSDHPNILTRLFGKCWR